jgi:hypothetical protein
LTPTARSAHCEAKACGYTWHLNTVPTFSMSKLSIAYQGPSAERRRALLVLLKAHPDAYFVEKDEGVFEVTTSKPFAELVAGTACWRPNSGV